MATPFSLACLFVDLPSGTARLERLDEEASRRWIGARGVGMHLLARSPAVSPTEPDSPLVFAIGPLVGTRVPSAGRAVISGFSPLTNTVCSSAVGGTLALEMKKAGIDALCITGKAHRRSVVIVHDGTVALEKDPWPDDTPVTFIASRLASPGGAPAVVGKAALMGCLYASIMVDGSFASGRGGLGLVMASKNVRAVVVRGTGSPRRAAADPAQEEKARSDIVRLFDASPFVKGRSGIAAFGTAALVDLVAERRMMPTANFRRTYFEGYRSFSAWAMRRSYAPLRHGCAGCPVACKKKAAGAGTLPEYETISHFGALNENDDLASIVKAHELCNSFGMDTISAASTIACLAEIRGDRYTGDGLVEKVRSIVDPATPGELLRQGSAILARHLGEPGASMSVKGLELPAYDPRGSYGMALAYGTSTRGGCHLRAYPIAHEILRKPVATDRFSFEGKARMIKIAEDLCAAVDTIGACRFAFIAATLEEYARGVSAVTGYSLTHNDLMRAGESVYGLERRINALRGFSPSDDLLPERFFREAGTPGPDFETPPIDRAAYLDALQRYYRIRETPPETPVAATGGPCTDR